MTLGQILLQLSELQLTLLPLRLPGQPLLMLIQLLLPLLLSVEPAGNIILGPQINLQFAADALPLRGKRLLLLEQRVSLLFLFKLLFQQRIQLAAQLGAFFCQLFNLALEASRRA